MKHCRHDEHCMACRTASGLLTFTASPSSLSIRPDNNSLYINMYDVSTQIKRKYDRILHGRRNRSTIAFVKATCNLHYSQCAVDISQAARQGVAVLMASAVVVLKHETSTLRQSHNFISIDLTFGVGDNVREITSPAKFGSDPMSGLDATFFLILPQSYSPYQ